MKNAPSIRVATCRSYLFVPGNRPERFDKACAAGAGAVIVDLEDAVAPDEKMSARTAVRDWLGSDKSPAQVERNTVFIRINSATTEWFFNLANNAGNLRDALRGQ